MMELILSKLFPPKPLRLDCEGHKEALAYQYRINRKGEERNPKVLAGAQIVSVVEGKLKHRPAPGTRESRKGRV